MSDNSKIEPTINEPPNSDDTSLPTHVNKESVAKYLLAHPSFLIDNPDLLVQIQVQLQERGVVSLTQIQAQQSRDKIKQLKSQLEDLVSNARKNELIYKTFADLNVDLAQAKSISDLDKSLKKHLVGSLQLDSAHIVLANDKNDSAHQLSEIQHRSIFDKKLARQPFYFGRVGKVEKAALFPNSQAESVALVLLNEPEDPNNKRAKPKVTGLLAIASSDPLHFQPDMDTVLVDYLRRNLNIHLNRML